MSWTSTETAAWVRGAVQDVQAALADKGKSVVRDGMFDARTWQAFKAVSGDSMLDSQGPRALASTALSGISDEAARAFAVAWAWWQVAWVKSDPGQAQATIDQYNAQLAAGGDAPLTAADAVLFLRPNAPSTKPTAARIALYSVIGVGLLFAGVIGWSAARRSKCGAPEDRRLGRRGGR